MLYLPVIALAVVATLAMTKRNPHVATRLGVVAVAAAAIAVTIAEVSGNVLLYYLGAFAAPFGVLLLLARAVGALRRELAYRRHT
jgi:uncharacterized membrane protein HdeD (DUF308 family)